MRKTLKKVFALTLALVLAFAMSVPAFAATSGTTYTITIAPGDYTDTTVANRYKAYEIFTGDLTDTPASGDKLTPDEENQLSNIKWGADVDVAKLVDALVTDTDNAFNDAFKDIKSITDADLQAATVAKILDNNKAVEGFAKAFAIVAQKNLKPACTLDDAATDATKSHPVSSSYNGTSKNFEIGLGKSGYYLVVDEYSGSKKGDIISEHILQVVRSREIDVKSDTPTVEKDILTRGGKGEYEIGETIKFQLVGTLAENFNNFVNAYQYKFVDTMSKGLTFAGEGTVTVEVWSVDDGELDAKVDSITLRKGTDYTVNVTNDTDETVLTVAFSNLKNITGLKAEYVIVVTYDAYINGDAVIGTPEINTVHVEFSNDPYKEESTTKTPDDEVEVQTFELDIVKKDAVSSNALAGVKFNLYKEVQAGAPDTTTQKLYGKFTGGTDGKYTLNTENAWTATKTDDTTLTTATGGILNIKGLAPGTYYLEEVETPAGYNALPGAIKIEITATYYAATDKEVTEKTKAEGELKSVTATYTIDGKTSALAKAGTANGTLGLLSLEILNIPISTLPGTGGIGNYIFYIGGGLLIAAAIVILIASKKRTAKN